MEIFESCKDVKEAVFYVEKTIQNNWSRSMLSHAIAAGFYKDVAKPLHNFALTQTRAGCDDDVTEIPRR